MSNFKERIIKKGIWFYDNQISNGVIIAAIDYDYWYEMEKADGFDMANEKPELNENGEMYMIYWTDQTFSQKTNETVGFLDIESTIKKAESIINQKVNWIS